jgi:methylated-DNA-protein-cysteine methyltransferase-like protein
MAKSKSAAKKNTGEHSFFEDVWEVVKLVPRGRVTTYGAIASYLGTKMSARMVGWAMNAAHLIPDVPAQRVVNRNGMLSGKAHFGTPTRMQELLEVDGVAVENDCVVQFAKLYWDPAEELGL